jgi:hypothetical protein
MKEKYIFILTFFLFFTLCFAEQKTEINYVYLNDIKSKKFDTNITDFSISYEPSLVSIKGLEKLKELKNIKLIGLPNLDNVSFLLLCNGLESITIDACTKIVDINGLFKLPFLKSIIIRSCLGLARVKEIDVDLQYLNKIEYIQLADCGIRSSINFHNIPKSLKYLNISYNKFESYDFISSISTNIQIYLFGNPISKLPQRKNIFLDINDLFKNVPIKYLGTY